ncbi:hypothetical protein [uncultured Bifidobacterium sp.]|uniref:hypothetical protein n=1 Tax=uncultured Bifidobacterium sp. TaxID=165187 RepID=UPI002598DB1B|nr:hypothetical protein [uncultured Bifidobacterium sp.]
MPRRTADEFSEGGIPFDYLSDEAKENAIENVSNDDGLYDVASMTIDEDLDSLKSVLESIGVELRDYNVGYPGTFATIRIDDRTEDDLMYPDATTNHLADIQHAEDDGYWIGVGVKEDWDKRVPELQAMVDAINAKLDGSDPDAEWPYYDGFDGETQELYNAYDEAAGECADRAIRDISDNYDYLTTNDEAIREFIEGSDFLFDEDGSLM